MITGNNIRKQEIYPHFVLSYAANIFGIIVQLHMSRFHSHVNTAKTIINLYKGEMPFSAFLKNYFGKEKKYGSRDRRTISSLCYNYFRIGFAAPDKSIDERLLIAVFLCASVQNEFLQAERPEWNEKISLP